MATRKNTAPTRSALTPARSANRRRRDNTDSSRPSRGHARYAPIAVHPPLLRPDHDATTSESLPFVAPSLKWDSTEFERFWVKTPSAPGFTETETGTRFAGAYMLHLHYCANNPAALELPLQWIIIGMKQGMEAREIAFLSRLGEYLQAAVSRRDSKRIQQETNEQIDQERAGFRRLIADGTMSTR